MIFNRRKSARVFEKSSDGYSDDLKRMILALKGRGWHVRLCDRRRLAINNGSILK